jgi:hypothetical protein
MSRVCIDIAPKKARKGLEDAEASCRRAATPSFCAPSSGSKGVNRRSGSAWSRARRSNPIRSAERAIDSPFTQCRSGGRLPGHHRADSRDHKDGLRGLRLRALFGAMRNECVSKPDAWGEWQGCISKEAEEARLKAERAAKHAARKQGIGALVFPDG